MAVHSLTDSSLTPFKVLADQLIEIREAKKQDPYGRAPYVKLQTKEETDPKKLQISPYMIGEGSYLTHVHKMYAGTRNFTANAFGDFLNGWGGGYIDFWHCDRKCTALALQTANNALIEELNEWDQSIKGENQSQRLEEFSSFLSEAKQMLISAQKTVFYIHQTYAHLTPSEVQEEQIGEFEKGSKEIHEQYQAISDSIKRIDALLRSVSLKMKPIGASFSKSEEEQMISKSTSAKDPLLFKDEKTASRWFLKQRDFCRKQAAARYPGDSIEKIHLQSSQDLSRSALLMGKAPQDFIRFAKSIDQEVKKTCRGDKISSSNFIAEVYERFKISQPDLIEACPDSFKMWLKELCMKGVSSATYQALFSALMNEERTGPYRLDLAPSALNAIMISPFFGLFDSSN